MIRSSCVPVFELLLWWLQRLHDDATRALKEWAQEPEWPLLIVGKMLLASFFAHWLGYRLAVHQVGWPAPLFAETEWEGRTGWRKPLVFGISNAMVSVSLREALRAQRLVPRGLVAHLAAWSTAVEVGVITLQAWRGVPSHFNVETHLDAALYAVKLAGVAALSAGCLAAAAGVLRGPPLRVSPAKACALRHGILLLVVAVAVGFAQVAYGHLPRRASPEEAEPCRIATAGAEGSPCYEIRGRAVVKLAHFLPLHATEVLLLLSWAAEKARQPTALSLSLRPCAQARQSGVRQADDGKATKPALALVRAAAAGLWLLALLGLWATAQGEDLRSPSWGSALVLLAALGSIPFAFVAVFVAPLKAGART